MAGRKKNKKSFSSNLANLFEQRLTEDNAQDKPSMFEAKKEEEKKTKKSTAKRTTRKSFSTNLEHLFQESLDILDGDISSAKRQNLAKSGKRAVGIDLLIKRTTAENVNVKREAVKPMTKRVTVVLETDTIDMLKSIAKEQKRPLTKLMAQLVEEFLEKGKK